jgi:hypothetical protein
MPVMGIVYRIMSGPYALFAVRGFLIQTVAR